MTGLADLSFRLGVTQAGSPAISWLGRAATRCKSVRVQTEEQRDNFHGRRWRSFLCLRHPTASGRATQWWLSTSEGV